METTTYQSVITRQVLEKAMSYQAYRELIDSLLAEGKTTGENQSEDLFNYAKINVQRMNRLDKTSQINPELKTVIEGVKEKWVWLILTEGWCGDAAQNIPTIVKIAELNPNIEVKLLLRDENLPIMDEYLTNGTRSIPILIALRKETLEELGIWGPRPTILQEKMLQLKKEGLDKNAIAEVLHKWYAENKSMELQKEFLALIQQWNQI